MFVPMETLREKRQNRSGRMRFRVLRVGRFWPLHCAVGERHGVRLHSESRLADIRHSLSACLQERVVNAGAGEEAMDEGVHVPHGEEVKAGRTSAAEAPVRLTAANGG